MITKNLVINIFVLFILVSTSVFSQGKIFIDFKTKLLEKPKLAHIKNATEWMLLKTDWGGITELTADFQFWIKNYKKNKVDNVVTLNLDLELRKVKSFQEGELLKKQPIEIIF